MTGRRVTAAIAFFTVGLLFTSRLAFAHAVLLDSSPAAESVLDVSPTEIRLGFNENVGPIFVKVLDATGTESGSPLEFRVEGNNVYLPLGNSLANGTYVVAYRVISADTHPVGGSVLFAVGEPIADVGSVADAGADASGWRAPVAVNRFLLYVAGALAAGSALLMLVLNLPAPLVETLKSQGRVCSLILGTTLVLAIGLGGAEMHAGGGSALFASLAWSTGLGSTLGSSAMLGLPGSIILWLALGKTKPAAGLLSLGALLVIGSFLVTGHAATAPPAWLMALVVAVHLVAVAFWFAALWPLRQAVRTLAAADAGAVLEQFSGRAVVAVGLLIVSGMVISWVQVQSLASFTATDYGVRLLFKVGLVAIILSLAVLNKQRLTGRLLAEHSGTAATLARSIGAEYVWMLLIMAAAVSLTLPSPPRALLASGGVTVAATGFTTQASKSGVNVSVEVTPARTGENMIMLKFSDANGEAMALSSVRIALSLPSASLEGVEREGEAMMPGSYHFMLNELIIPGEWEIRIDAFVDDFDKKILRVTVPIQ